MTVYRAAPADTLAMVPLDELIAVYHRPAGATHLLAEPVPQLLAALQAGPADLAALVARLADEFELGPDPGDALAGHLAELVEAGLVSAA